MEAPRTNFSYYPFPKAIGAPEFYFEKKSCQHAEKKGASAYREELIGKLVEDSLFKTYGPEKFGIRSSFTFSYNDVEKCFVVKSKDEETSDWLKLFLNTAEKAQTLAFKFLLANKKAIFCEEEFQELSSKVKEYENIWNNIQALYHKSNNKHSKEEFERIKPFDERKCTETELILTRVSLMILKGHNVFGACLIGLEKNISGSTATSFLPIDNKRLFFSETQCKLVNEPKDFKILVLKGKAFLKIVINNLEKYFNELSGSQALKGPSILDLMSNAENIELMKTQQDFSRSLFLRAISFLEDLEKEDCNFSALDEKLDGIKKDAESFMGRVNMHTGHLKRFESFHYFRFGGGNNSASSHIDASTTKRCYLKLSSAIETILNVTNNIYATSSKKPGQTLQDNEPYCPMF